MIRHTRQMFKTEKKKRRKKNVRWNGTQRKNAKNKSI